MERFQRMLTESIATEFFSFLFEITEKMKKIEWKEKKCSDMIVTQKKIVATKSKKMYL